jgi:fatty acid desaturase
MNPISRFLYWNMNYHVEHHMFPMVPYHALPKLHETIKHDLPAPDPVDLGRLSRDGPDLAAPAQGRGRRS